jgi:sulfopyruvate decarboxylase TPP-binding subunit
VFTSEEIVETFEGLGLTHVVWIPDTTMGQWDGALQAAENLNLIQVCREGEAWAIAAGLHLGGAKPIVCIQCTGLFESGDALRNVAHDYQLPIFGLIGYRSFLNTDSLPGDTCLKFTEPVLNAWDLDTVFIDTEEKKPLLAEHYRACQEKQVPGIALMAEGAA